MYFAFGRLLTARVVFALGILIKLNKYSLKAPTHTYIHTLSRSTFCQQTISKSIFCAFA